MEHSKNHKEINSLASVRLSIETPKKKLTKWKSAIHCSSFGWICNGIFWGFVLHSLSRQDQVTIDVKKPSTIASKCAVSDNPKSTSERIFSINWFIDCFCTLLLSACGVHGLTLLKKTLVTSMAHSFSLHPGHNASPRKWTRLTWPRGGVASHVAVQIIITHQDEIRPFWIISLINHDSSEVAVRMLLSFYPSHLPKNKCAFVRDDQKLV